MNKLLKISWALILLFCGVSVFSADSIPTPDTAAVATSSAVGLWKTIDDKSSEARSIVEIFEKDEKLFGKIVKIYPHQGNQDTCTQCKDEFKDKLILGLQFMWDLKKISEKSQAYDGGKILDPENGTVYRAKIKLISNGTKLEVRGYMGISLFGRSQEWLKATPEDLK